MGAACGRDDRPAALFSSDVGSPGSSEGEETNDGLTSEGTGETEKETTTQLLSTLSILERESLLFKCSGPFRLRLLSHFKEIAP